VNTKLGRRLWGLACFVVSLLCYSEAALAVEISGRITSTMTITENSVLVGDVTCAVENAACIVLGAPNITLDLDGYAITGLANAATACEGGGVGAEIGIDVSGQNGAVIRGPGVVRQIRGFGIRLLNSNDGKISGVTTSTNCFAGIYLQGSSGHLLEGNVAVRNGHLVNPCGGI
jgi:parallel beta-helix repeat protein